MPARKELPLTTSHDNQTEALIIVYEGEENSVVENHLLATLKSRGFVYAYKGTPEVKICVDINVSNVL